MNSEACGTGSGRNRTAYARLNMAELAPIPKASEMMATRANPGLFRRVRKAYRRSLNMRWRLHAACRTAAPRICWQMRRVTGKLRRAAVRFWDSGFPGGRQVPPVEAQPGGLEGRRRPRDCPTAGFS